MLTWSNFGFLNALTYHSFSNLLYVDDDETVVTVSNPNILNNTTHKGPFIIDMINKDEYTLNQLHSEAEGYCQEDDLFYNNSF